MRPILCLALFVLSLSSWAATPPSQEVTIPTTAGESVTVTWTGEVPPGANATSRCTLDPTGSTEDAHSVTVIVPEGAYQGVTISANFKMVWEDDLQDLILTVETDGLEIASSDGGAPEENVSLQNPPAGVYDAIGCAFASANLVAYTAELTLVAQAASNVVAPPSADAQGLAFSASVPADFQRDIGEPIIEIDAAGNVYTCGPTGTSAAEDYAQVSDDGGDQFHLLGEPPRGQTSLGGGGDCGFATSPELNDQGFHQIAYTGLSGLANFTTATSADGGRTFIASPLSESNPGVDRQWNVFTDVDTVFLNYNQVAPRAVTVQRSDDGGLTYGPPVAISPNPGSPGQMRSLPPELNPAQNGLPAVYYSWGNGVTVMMAVSLDEGDTWNNCRAVEELGNVDQKFTIADHDADGNIYVVYTSESDFNTYVAWAPAAALLDCQEGTTAPFGGEALFSKPVQVNRDDVVTSVFPWLTASGDSGRVAVSFYGSKVSGRPDDASLPHTWHVYVSQSLNANTAEPDWAMVQATTHPNHYGQICLNGLGCTTGGDRTLVDFFAVDYNQANGELAVVYNTSYKTPPDVVGLTASAMVTRQIAGPSLGGGMINRPDREPLRQATEDPLGDALADFSSLVTPPMTANIPAADITAVSVGPALDLASGELMPDGGFTVTMQIDDLSDAALQGALSAIPSQSLLWVYRYVDGYRASAVSARWNPVEGFTFGHNGFVSSQHECGTPPVVPAGVTQGQAEPDDCIYYPGSNPIQGDVDQATGTIRLTLPLHMISALSGEAGPSTQPQEVPAQIGDRLYSTAAFTAGNPTSPTQDSQTFLVPLDNAPAMDVLILAANDSTDPGLPEPTPVPEVTAQPGNPTQGDSSDGAGRRGGMLGLMVLALLLMQARTRLPGRPN